MFGTEQIKNGNNRYVFVMRIDMNRVTNSFRNSLKLYFKWYFSEMLNALKFPGIDSFDKTMLSNAISLLFFARNENILFCVHKKLIMPVKSFATASLQTNSSRNHCHKSERNKSFIRKFFDTNFRIVYKSYFMFFWNIRSSRKTVWKHSKNAEILLLFFTYYNLERTKCFFDQCRFIVANLNL